MSTYLIKLVYNGFLKNCRRTHHTYGHFRKDALQTVKKHSLQRVFMMRRD